MSVFYMIDQKDWLSRDKSKLKIALMRIKKSSNILGIGYKYYDSGSELYVLFNTGIVYSYENVPLPLIADFMTEDNRRESTGKFFNRNIKGKKEYPYKKINPKLYKGLLKHV